MLISAIESVKIDDRSTLGAPGESVVVANFGNELAEIGAGVQVYGDLRSASDVDFLRSQSHVFGSVHAAGQVIQQDNVLVDGGIFQGETTESRQLDHQVRWPLVSGGAVSIPPDTAHFDLEPGRHGSVHIYSRSNVNLRTGTYYLDSLNTEPQVTFNIDNSEGPVFLYVKDSLRINAQFNYAGARGQLLLSYFGTQTALIQEAIVATIIAPNSAIELRRPGNGAPHEGAFFGKRVQIFSDATVLALPFDFSYFYGPRGQPVDLPVGVPQSALNRLSPDVLTGIRYVHPDSPFSSINVGLPPGGVVLAAGLTEGVCNQALASNFELRITKHRGGKDGVANPNAESYVRGEFDFIDNFFISDLPDCDDEECPTITSSAVADFALVRVHFELWERDKGPNGQDDLELTLDFDVDNFLGTMAGSWEGRTNGDNGSISGGGERCVTTEREFTLCWEVVPSAKPPVCPEATVDYVDAGLGEDFLNESGLQSVRMPFTRARVQVEVGGELVSCFDGFLDVRGCVPQEFTPSLRAYSGGGPVTVISKLRTDQCLDPTGESCKGRSAGCLSRLGDDESPALCDETTGAAFRAGPAIDKEKRDPVCLQDERQDLESCELDFTSANHAVAELCLVVTEDSSRGATAFCDTRVVAETVLTFNSNGYPYVAPAMESHDAATRVAAIFSKLLQREHTEGPDFGVVNQGLFGVLDSFQNDVPYRVFVDHPCPFSGGLNTSYTTADYMCLELPSEEVVTASGFKTVILHETGHVIQIRRGVNSLIDYRHEGEGKWGCAHIDESRFGNALHCLQGIEQSVDAQVEGFAHYYAAKVLNVLHSSSDCSFSYYKPVLADTCMAAEECENLPDGLVLNLPPVTVDCRQAIKHRNQDPGLSDRIAAGEEWEVTAGTEWDWMNFYTAADIELGIRPQTWSTIYRRAENSESNNPFVFVSFDGTPSLSADLEEWYIGMGFTPVTVSLLDHIEAVLGLSVANDIASFGNEYGVSTDISP